MCESCIKWCTFRVTIYLSLFTPGAIIHMGIPMGVELIIIISDQNIFSALSSLEIKFFT